MIKKKLKKILNMKLFQCFQFKEHLIYYQRKIPELEEKIKERELFFNKNKDINASSKSNYDIEINKINEIKKNIKEINKSKIINDRILTLNYRLSSNSYLNHEKERENLINKNYTRVDTKND